MLRKESLEQVTDGGRYTSDSLVRIDPDGCRGCHLCCETVGDTIVLDPYDVFCLTAGLGRSFEELMRREISLGIYDGIILPHLNLVEDGEKGTHCVFLGQSGASAGRCTIHDFRPGFCRLYPMGRLYEEDRFSYVILKDQCPYPEKKECRVRVWLGIGDLDRYEAFVLSWHGLIARIRDGLQGENEEDKRRISLYLLQVFYFTAYRAGFYEDLYERMEKVKRGLFGE